MKKKVFATALVVFLLLGVQESFSASNSVNNPKRKEAIAQKQSKKQSRCKQGISLKKIAKLVKSKRKEIASYQAL